jgi:hypothetical protein
VAHSSEWLVDSAFAAAREHGMAQGFYLGAWIVRPHQGLNSRRAQQTILES